MHASCLNCLNSIFLNHALSYLNRWTATFMFQAAAFIYAEASHAISGNPQQTYLFAQSSQNATAELAATLSESTPWLIGMIACLAQRESTASESP